MSNTLLVLGCFALFFWLYFLWSRRRFYKVAWQLPGPVGLPFIGVGLEMMHPEKFLSNIERIAKNYNSPYISWMGTQCFLYVNDPETVQAIFNSSECTNKGDLYRFMASVIGDGLFTSSSPRWNKHRRLINPAFSRQVINNFLPIFNAEADVLLEKFAEHNNAKLEIYAMLKKSVLEAACQTTMGKKMNFHNDGSTAIFAAYNSITEVCVKRMLSPWFYPDIIYRRSLLFARERKVIAILMDFVENLLQLGRNKTDKTTLMQQSKQSHSMLDTELKADKDNKENTLYMGKTKANFLEQVRGHIEQGQLTWQDVRDEANVIVAATFETTSTALYLVCLCLAMHPEYQDKLYEELVQLFPDNVNEVSHKQLERMTYADMLINEAMRLFAPVPVVLRDTANDFQLPSGVTVPRGTQIAIDIFNMQRSEKIWGPAAHCFRPELHFGADSSASRHPFSFIPFTKGLRMCIGFRYALMLMKVMLAKIFRNYRLHTNAKLQDLKIKGTISLKLIDYPLCELKQR